MTKTDQIKTALDPALSADKDVTHAAAQHRHSTPARIAAWLAQAGDQPQLITLSIGTAAVGLAVGRRDLARGGARMLAAHLLATAAKSALKDRIDRSRPKHALETGEERLQPGTSDKHELRSFPSGHTAGAVAVARAASHEIASVAVPTTLATIAIAGAQPFAGNHYLSDMAAGAAIGWASEALVGVVFDRWTWGTDADQR